MAGYIRLWRKQFENGDQLWKRSKVKSQWEAWQWLLSITQYRREPAKATVADGLVVPVYTGEFCVSTRKLARKMGWAHKRARLFLGFLQKLGRIGHTDRHRHGVWQVVNWQKYNKTARAHEGTPPGTEVGTAPGAKRAQQRGDS